MKTRALKPQTRPEIPGVLPPDQELIELFSATSTVSGANLLALLDAQPMLLIFLRHLGCASARETLHDVQKALPALTRRGVRPVFVHMASDERARPFFTSANLSEVERVSDPTMRLYRAPEFNLLKSVNVHKYLTMRSRWKLAKRATWRYGIGPAGGEDSTQLPGVFFIKDRAIYRAYRHKYLSDRPDYTTFGA